MGEALPVTATVYTTSDGLSAGPVRELHISPSGRPYARTASGWQVLEGPRWKAAADPPAAAPAPHAEDLPAAAGAVLSVDKAGAMRVAGCEHGLYLRRAPSEDWEDVPIESLARSLQAVSIVTLDETGVVWFGAHEGLGYIEKGKARLVLEGQPFGRYTSGVSGADGVVWFGAEKGLLRVQGERVWRYAGRELLPNDHVTSLARAGETVLWVATLGGVSRIAIP